MVLGTKDHGPWFLGLLLLFFGLLSYVSGTSLNDSVKNLITPLPGVTMGWYIVYLLGCKSYVQGYYSYVQGYYSYA